MLTQAAAAMSAADSGEGWPWELLAAGFLALLLHAAVTWAAKSPAPPGAEQQPPSADAGLLILQQLKSDADERREEAALRFVQVRRWDGPVSAMVQLRLTSGAFFASALAAVRITGAARLYTFKDGNWETRQPLTEATFPALLRQSRDLSSFLPDVFIFEPIPGAQASSPGEPPLTARLAQDVEVPQAAALEDACSSRSSAVQTLFRVMLLHRDGNDSACALCRELPVEAAHVIPRIASAELLRRACLPSADVVSNGILLCPACHLLHDQFLWHYLPSAGVVVADALASDSDIGQLWSARAGRQLTRPEGEMEAGWWPPEAVWRAAYAGYEAAREARHAFADDNKHSCIECDWRGKTARGLQRHHCSRVKTKFFTPLSLRQAAGGGGGRDSRSAE